MKEIHVVIGANFGDEGKGQVTNNICKKIRKETKKTILNIRFNGGAQAGHTVRFNGKQHVFHHFGSGSFHKNVITVLGDDFIVNPILFRQEYEELLELGVEPKVMISKNCRVTLPSDMMNNQLRKDIGEHHSCGVGILETVKAYEGYSARCRCGDYYYGMCDVLLAKDLQLSDRKPYRKLAYGIGDLIDKQFIEDYKFMNEHITIYDDNYKFDDNYIVFEGAQGLLLDMDNHEYFPNLTPSNTGLKNVVKFINKYFSEDEYFMSINYVTRSYMTRHGRGRFDTECDVSDLGINPLVETTNVFNEYQGSFRWGYLDLELLKNSISKDLECINNLQNKNAKIFSALCITHIRDTNWFVKINSTISIKWDYLHKILSEINFPTTHNDKNKSIFIKWYK